MSLEEREIETKIEKNYRAVARKDSTRQANASIGDVF